MRLFLILCSYAKITILLTKASAAQNEVALSYHGMRGLYFLAVIFAATITSSKEIVQVGLQARYFPTSVILVPLVFICSSNR